MDIERLKQSQRDRYLDSVQIKEFFIDMNLNDFKNKRVLEVGCGNGYVLVGLKKNNEIKPYGIDLFDIEVLENKKYINFVKKDIFEANLKDFENEGFDFIYSFRMFAYLTHEEKFKLFNKLYREFLKPGGVMLIDIGGSVYEDQFRDLSSEDSYLRSRLISLYDLDLKVFSKEYIFDKDLALMKETKIFHWINILIGVYNRKKYKSMTLRIVKR